MTPADPPSTAAGRSARLRTLLAAVAVGAVVAGASAGCGGGEAGTAGADPGADATTTTTTSTPADPAAAGSLRVRVTSEVAPPERVAPPSGDPNERVDRDAGITARLSDGSRVWFWGDTGDRLPDESLRYFVIGSASWSFAQAPTVVVGGTSSGQVVPFATPTADFIACPPEAPDAGMWPLSAVTDPTDADRVVLWMANICLGSGGTAVGRGISVGEWRYDPTDPPIDRPITVRVLEQNLFGDDEFGEAALVDGDRIVVYECRMPDDPLDAQEPGACRAARVAPDRVADGAAYEMWDGSDWVAGGDAAPMVMPPGPSGFVPPGAVSVGPAPDGDGYLMLSSPWPGYVPFVEVRAARSPQGPWGEPTVIDLVGCEQTFRGRRVSCYSANLQPDFSEPGRMAFGYYDQFLSGPPQLGSYLLTSVGIELVAD